MNLTITVLGRLYRMATVMEGQKPRKEWVQRQPRELRESRPGLDDRKGRGCVAD